MMFASDSRLAEGLGKVDEAREHALAIRAA
jgi:hypothetical protein